MSQLVMFFVSMGCQTKGVVVKLYALRVIDNKDRYWDTYAYSHDTQKLASVVRGVASWNLGKSDISNNKYEVMYTDTSVYPRYSIEEVPFII